MQRKFIVTFEDGLPTYDVGRAVRAIGMIRGVYETEHAANPAKSAQTDKQHAKVDITRLKELRDQTVFFMGLDLPIGSAYVYDTVNKFINSVGE